MKLLLILVVLIITTIGTTIFWDLAYFPKLDSANLRPVQVLAADNRPQSPGLIKRQEDNTCFPKLGSNPEDCIEPAEMPVAAAAAKLAARSSELYAFLPFQPDWTHISLKKNLGLVDVLMPEWYDFDPDIVDLQNLNSGTAYQVQILDLIAAYRSRLKLLPVVRIASYSRPTVETPSISASRARRSALALLDEASARGYNGICLDFSNPWSDIKQQADTLVPAFAEVFKKAGKETCLSLGFDALSTLAPADTALLDHLVVLVGRQAAELGFPAALAPQPLIEEQARIIAGRPDAEKIVVALGTQSVQWGSSLPTSEKLSYVEAMSRLGYAGSVPKTAGDTLNSYAEFTDPNGQFHAVWIQDVASAFNEVSTFSETPVHRYAIWPIGGEDPATWSLFRSDPDVGKSLAFTDISGYVTYSGSGPLLGYSGYPVTGIRSLSVSADDRRITDLEQIQMPAPHQLIRWGQLPDNSVVLTFDDGPDPVYTDQILDILRELDVQATFFVVGDKISENWPVIGRMVHEGHLIGSHSYTHAQLDEKSSLRTRVELAAVQKALESTAGRNTLLFRMPYGWSTGPIDGTTARPFGDVTASGYILVSGEIDPPDWQQLSAKGILSYVERELATGTGRIIVMHDSGGNRENVVAALGPMIEQLRENGYRFASLAEVIGASQNDLMPVTEASASLLERMSFLFLEYLTVVLEWTFWLVVAMGVSRALAIIILSQLRKPHSARVKVAKPAVSVLVPAYCEETVIGKTVEAVLASDYENFDVIVVDDGSTDNTFDVLQRQFGKNPRVRLLRKENGGKASALNLALANTDAEFVVAIDSDTMIMPDAIGMLVHHFTDPRIGAVAGNVKVGNRLGILTKFQALEYITAQNIDRRAQELVNGVLVVPGSIGAWRKSAIMAAGYYKSETLAEDADLTVSVIRSGYRVVFEPKAIAITEAPETVRQFMRQRLRWILGMMQMGWKHKSAVLKGKGLGLISLPDLFFFGVLMPVLAPLADFAFVLALYNLVSDAVSDTTIPYNAERALQIVLAYLALPLLDVLIAVMAFQLEPREQRRLIALVPLQRFFYRQLLYISALRALRRALTGNFEGWEKITRMSSVSALNAGELHHPAGAKAVPAVETAGG
jgi:cellulose synthase/poly-beta-1,6-N-acetylglucosamine synthase-like glycosyltransferase/peptidoglycan/xylan/chitin deacetylase (PgdA/CDA1 family)